MTTQAIVDAVRNAIGSPATSEYPDTKIEDCVTRGLIEYSNYVPLKYIDYFTTVVGTQSYELSDIAIFAGYDVATFLDIEEIFYKGISASSLIDAAFDIDILLDNTLNFGINTFIQPSLQILENKEISNIQNYTIYETEIFNDTTVYLIPKPTSIQRVYFIYRAKRLVANLKDKEYQDIIDFVFVQAARDLGNKREKLLQASDPGSGYVMFFGGKHLIKEADIIEKKLKNKFGVKNILRHS